MENLTRYNLERFNRTETMDNFHQMVASDEGVWVKFSDIKEFLQTAHNSAMVPCPHVWSFYIAHPPVEECKLCGSLRKAQHQ